MAQPVELVTCRESLIKLYTADVTTPTAIPAAGASVVIGNIASGNGYCHMSANSLLVGFWGVGTAGQIGKARIWGLKRISPDSLIKIPYSTVDFTLGTGTGTNGTPIDSNQKFADGITVTGGVGTVDAGITNGMGRLKIDMTGCEFVQVEVALGTVGTSVNAGIWTI